MNEFVSIHPSQVARRFSDLVQRNRDATVAFFHEIQQHAPVYRRLSAVCPLFVIQLFVNESLQGVGVQLHKAIATNVAAAASQSAKSNYSQVTKFRGLSQGIKCRELEMCPRPKTTGMSTKVCPLRQTFEPCDHGFGHYVTHKC